MLVGRTAFGRRLFEGVSNLDLKGITGKQVLKERMVATPV
jgi:hypothetical protein